MRTKDQIILENCYLQIVKEAKMNRHAVDLITKSNKPENIQSIIDNGYAHDFALILAKRGEEIPDAIFDFIKNYGRKQIGMPEDYANSDEYLRANNTQTEPKEEDILFLNNLPLVYLENGKKIPEKMFKEFLKHSSASNLAIKFLKKYGLEKNIPDQILQKILQDKAKSKYYSVGYDIAKMYVDGNKKHLIPKEIRKVLSSKELKELGLFRPF